MATTMLALMHDSLLAAVCVCRWMNSPGHRANILNPDITHTGLRTASNGAKEYATKVFAQCR